MLVGIIWIIQRVHYPAFKYVGSAKADDFHHMHTLNITPIVAPLMVAELILVCYEVYIGSHSVAWIYLLLVLIIWGSTFGIQVPLHNRLSSSYKGDEVERLIKTNWIRTVAWSVKLAVMFYYF